MSQSQASLNDALKTVYLTIKQKTLELRDASIHQPICTMKVCQASFVSSLDLFVSRQKQGWNRLEKGSFTCGFVNDLKSLSNPKI